MREESTEKTEIFPLRQRSALQNRFPPVNTNNTLVVVLYRGQEVVGGINLGTNKGTKDAKRCVFSFFVRLLALTREQNPNAARWAVGHVPDDSDEKKINRKLLSSINRRIKRMCRLGCCVHFFFLPRLAMAKRTKAA